MNKISAKKIALFEASKILEIALKDGWTPPSHYSGADSDRIREAMYEVVESIHSRALPKDAEPLGGWRYWRRMIRGLEE